MTKTIFIDSKNYTNVKFFDWLEVMCNKKDIYKLYNNQVDEENEIRNTLRKDSKVYQLFNKYINKYSFKNEVKVESFKDAEYLINSSIKFVDIFNKNENEKFEDELCFYNKLKIIKNNKLMFCERGQAVFNNNVLTCIDMYNKTVTIIQLYKIINNIKYYQKAIELICAELNIKIGGREMILKMNEREKAANNIAMLNDLDRYPNLKKLINKNKFLLEACQIFAINNSFASAEFDNNNNLIFLVTSTYMHNYLKNVAEQIKAEDEKEIKVLDTRYIRRIMLMFETLELIQIAEPTTALKNRENKDNKYIDSYKYYTIPFYSHKILLKAEEIAEKLRANNITASNISKAKIEKLIVGAKVEEKKEKYRDEFYFDFSIN